MDETLIATEIMTSLSMLGGGQRMAEHTLRYRLMFDGLMRMSKDQLQALAAEIHAVELQQNQ